jgi:hypothetical protein
LVRKEEEINPAAVGQEVEVIEECGDQSPIQAYVPTVQVEAPMNISIKQTDGDTCLLTPS